jgi:hypothetical protein
LNDPTILDDDGHAPKSDPANGLLHNAKGLVQIAVVEAGQFHVVNSVLTADGAKRLYLRELLKLGLPEQVKVEVNVVPELGADSRTGKFRRIINSVGPPPALSQLDEEINSNQG